MIFPINLMGLFVTPIQSMGSDDFPINLMGLFVTPIQSMGSDDFSHQFDGALSPRYKVWALMIFPIDLMGV